MALSKIESQALDVGQIGGRRNLIINGAMQVAQRGTSFTNLGNGSYGLDRFSVTKITDGAVDIKQTADVPTASEAGYLLTQCLHADVTTADATVSVSNMYALLQAIEYKNIVQAGFGQSGTRYLTASFWVKSTKTGTFCCFIKSADHARAYVKEYTVSASDTWEYKTLTFTVDTTGGSSWNHNDVGATIGWTLYGGTNYHITADTWTATSNNYAPCTSNQVNALDSDANNFKITGVQLEVGDTATPFEHRSFGEELLACYRYYYKLFPELQDSYCSGSIYAYSTSNAVGNGMFPVKMRIAPTAIEISAATDWNLNKLAGYNRNVTGLTWGNTTNTQFYNLNYACSSNDLTSASIHYLKSANANAYIAWSAEL